MTIGSGKFPLCLIFKARRFTSCSKILLLP